MYSIYVHIFPDGRKYVGSTGNDLKRRWQGGYRHNKILHNAINSVGWNNIQHQVLETVIDKETALKREEYYTLLWRTNEIEYGYNLKCGNKCYNGRCGKTNTEEHKRKISESMKKHHSRNYCI